MAEKKTEKKDVKLGEKETEDNSDAIKNETVEFKGKYIKAIGRRKSSVAQVRLYDKGKGIIIVNSLRLSEYFPGDMLTIITQSLKVLGKLKDFNFSVLVKGGGKKGQAEAVRLGISRTLLAYDETSRDILKISGFLTRDPRRKERKKPGLKKARKKPQWSKR